MPKYRIVTTKVVDYETAELQLRDWFIWYTVDEQKPEESVFSFIARCRKETGITDIKVVSRSWIV